jgi:hypothetical protein
MWAGDHYIRAGATGSGSGSDWVNACPGFTASCAPSSMVRGDTYYVADGTYTPATFSTAPSSTRVITIKKATSAEHGTDTGWSSAYGDGVATFTKGLDIASSYWVIDGVTGGGPASWKTGFGFYIDTKAGGVGVSVSNGAGGFVTVRHAEIQGDGDDGDCTGCGEANDGVYVGEGSNNVFEYLYVHHQGRVPFFIRSDNTRIQYSWVEHNESTPGEHSEGISAWKGSTAEVRNLVVANNVWKDMEGTGTLVCECDGWDVYGNVFWGVGNAGTGHGAVTSWSNSDVYNVRIHNNTFVDTSKGINFFVDGSYRRDNITAYNNLFYNTNATFEKVASHNYSWFYNASGTFGESQAQVGTGNPFVNLTNGDFHLTLHTASGMLLTAPFDIDPDGDTRNVSGSWDRGAFQFGSVSNRPNPPTSLTSSVR